jgi:hypothetical protein
LTRRFVISSIGLTTTYGVPGYQSLLAKLNGLSKSDATGATSVHILDDAADMGASSLAPAASQSPQDLRSALRPLLKTGDTVLIIGDQRCFPAHPVQNPVSDRSIDPDPTILTDNPYGDLSGNAPESCTLPEISVGRIAAGVTDSAQDLAALLDWMGQPSVRSGYVEITSRQWRDTSSFVMAALASSQRVFVSPDDRITSNNAANLDCRFLYCNLHGFASGGPWMGFDPALSLPVPAVVPAAFQSMYVSGTVCFTEACYGLATNGISTSSSCALSLLAAGAKAVVGATGLAYGTATDQSTDLIDADAMAKGFFNNALIAAQSVGDCIQAARRLLASTSSPSDPYVKKTLLEFQLLGDPSYVLS